MASSPMFRGSRTPATCELCGPSSSVGSGVLCHRQRPSYLWHGMVKRATLIGCGGSPKLPTQGILCQKISNFSLIHIVLSRSTRVAGSTRRNPRLKRKSSVSSGNMLCNLWNYAGVRGLLWEQRQEDRRHCSRCL